MGSLLQPVTWEGGWGQGKSCLQLPAITICWSSAQASRQVRVGMSGSYSLRASC